MANIKSAKKRILQNTKKAEVNRSRRSKIRSSIKNLNILLSSKKKDDAKKSFFDLENSIAKAASKGVYKKNTASRIISRLSHKLKSLN